MSDFNSTIENILNNLNITDSTIKDEIKKSLEKLSKDAKYEFVKNPDVKKLTEEMIKKDMELHTILNKIKNNTTDTDLQDRIEKIKKEFGILQGAILFRKTKRDCNQAVSLIVEGIGNKIKVVNKIILELDDKDLDVPKLNKDCWDIILEKEMLDMINEVFGISDRAINYTFYDIIREDLAMPVKDTPIF
jgi:hypothetical protein